MSEFRGTPGPWSYRKTGQHWNNSSLTNIEINYGTEGECIADTVYEELDAQLIIAAPELLELVITANLGDKGSHTAAWQEKARKAITKALGQ